jgi:hypothetical protein
MSEDDFKEIRGLLQELVTKQALHSHEQNSMKESLDQIKHVLLEGNGSPPMTIQVATMDQRIKQLEEDSDDKKVPRHISLGIWVSIILAAGSMLVGFIKG